MVRKTATPEQSRPAVVGPARFRKNQFGDHEVPTDDVAVYLDSSDITLVISFSLLPFLFLNTAAKNLLASMCNKVPT